MPGQTKSDGRREVPRRKPVDDWFARYENPHKAAMQLVRNPHPRDVHVRGQDRELQPTKQGSRQSSVPHRCGDPWHASTAQREAATRHGTCRSRASRMCPARGKAFSRWSERGSKRRPRRLV